ncbi:NADH-quinone oxidoreductase subunit C [Kitasatospora sp. RB6PN24]|uniref:NADH-quinone oxidoreductase subunit C n=1 Tax=Kitasatospora humi TaxID=2893891 RepID=UPI001E5BD329|nr:NADH-quinone oxidoreductase subunit C [Kitasatospora humi]MCC9310768.1 NADH-quinone oxidoreductase subunit C [Kitasatospora humi]
MTAALEPERTAAAIGPWATAAAAYELLTVDVPAEHWIEALTAARDGLGLAFFDWLSAVDELAEGFSVSAHLAAVGEPGAVRHLLLRTRVPRDGAVLPTAVGVFAGAAWHERETTEMFGIEFTGHPHPAPLLLPEGFEGHPLRKEFVLAARVAKAWPGAKEPGESDHGDGPARRKMQPVGVPDPNEWGPLKGTLPPVAERPARAARGPRAAAGAAAGAEGTRPVRADRPRRNRSITEGSASQTAAPAAQPTEPAEAPRTEAPRTEAPRVARTQSADAPWHSPVPAYDEPSTSAEAEKSAEPTSGAPTAEPGQSAEPSTSAEAEKSAEPTSGAPTAEPGQSAEPSASAEAEKSAESTSGAPAAEPGKSTPSTSGSPAAGTPAEPQPPAPEDPQNGDSA